MTAPIPAARVDHLVAWLREHRAAFREDALRDRLLEAGYPPDDVDAAFEILRLELEAQPAGAPTPGAEPPGVPPPTRAAWPPPVAQDRSAAAGVVFIGAVMAIVGIPWLLAVAGAAAFAVPVAIVALLLALVGWGVSRDGKHPGVATGLGVALLTVVVLPVVAVVAVFGYCLVAGGRLY